MTIQTQLAYVNCVSANSTKKTIPLSPESTALNVVASPSGRHGGEPETLTKCFVSPWSVK